MGEIPFDNGEREFWGPWRPLDAHERSGLWRDVDLGLGMQAWPSHGWDHAPLALIMEKQARGNIHQGWRWLARFFEQDFAKIENPGEPIHMRKVWSAGFSRRGDLGRELLVAFVDKPEAGANCSFVVKTGEEWSSARRGSQAGLRSARALKAFAKISWREEGLREEREAIGSAMKEPKKSMPPERL